MSTRRVLRRTLGLTLWLIGVLLLAEGGLRALGVLLRRDPGLAGAPPGTSVIYCLGDSFTYGQGVKTEEAWPQVLARLLRDEAGADMPVRPWAEPGRSSSAVEASLAAALKAGDARLVLIMTGWNANDGDFAAHAEALRQPVPWTTRVDIWLEQSHLYRVVKQALTYRSRTQVLDDVKIVPQTTAMSLYGFHAYQEIALENLHQIARMCRAANVPCALITYPHQELPPNLYTRSEYYHFVFGHQTPLSEDDYLFHDRRPDEIAIDAVIRHVGEAEGLPVIDLQPAFQRAQGEDLFLGDLHHPTARGHELIARTVLDAIRPTLRRDQLPRPGDPTRSRPS